MFDFHSDKARYFDIQCKVTEENIIPFIFNTQSVESKNILEIGCAEAGVLKAFLKQGHQVVGVELSESRYELAKQFLSVEISENKARILNKNIYDIDPSKEFDQLFDVIILKDVIEHIPEQEKFIPLLKNFLNDDGIIFFAYPPWWMPFGGHQQICNHKLLRMLPWFHLFPNFLYKSILKLFGENQLTINELMEVKSTGIIIERIYKLIQESGFKIENQKFWLINPIYKYKFGLDKKEVLLLFSKLAYIRNIYTTAHYISFKR
jgi:2-polyprenyl-3-methyl-5-hydroxy-6-metoxy-1,4-benzoquinol methylase